jgi:hypothetical protein
MILTFHDVVEHLITASFGGPQDAEQRDIRTAVHRAYQEVTTMRDWSFYHVHGRVITQAPVTAGTVSFSTATNQLTLSGATWPAWANDGYVRSGPRVARVAARNSDTVVTLDAEVTFPEDFSGQGYILYRTVYPLPDDLRNMDEPSNEFFWWSGIYLTPDEAMKVERVNYRSGYPLHWTIVKDPDSYGWAVKLIGYPIKTETIDFTYRRRARGLRYSGHEAAARAGTISSSGTAVTGTDTSFDSKMVGSILRVGTSSSYPDPITGMNPFSTETFITAVGDAVSLTTAAAAGASGAKYLVTDPIDVPAHMHTVILSGAEYWLARIRNNKPDNAFAMYQRDLRLAMEQDVLAPMSGRSKDIWSDRGWRSPLQPDQGT